MQLEDWEVKLTGDIPTVEIRGHSVAVVCSTAANQQEPRRSCGSCGETRWTHVVDQTEDFVKRRF